MGAQWKQKWREMAADQKGKITGKLVREISREFTAQRLREAWAWRPLAM